MKGCNSTKCTSYVVAFKRPNFFFKLVNFLMINATKSTNTIIIIFRLSFIQFLYDEQMTLYHDILRGFWGIARASRACGFQNSSLNQGWCCASCSWQCQKQSRRSPCLVLTTRSASTPPTGRSWSRRSAAPTTTCNFQTKLVYEKWQELNAKYFTCRKKNPCIIILCGLQIRGFFNRIGRNWGLRF